METCNELQIPVTFIVPFDKTEEGINPAYRVIQKAYSSYVPEKEWQNLKSYRSKSTLLDQLPNILFSDKTTSFDQSLSFSKYVSGEQEILNIVNRIKKLISLGYTTEKKVAIVTPNSKELRPLVREVSENVGLPVDVPERPFLGLTAGEFVRLIYAIKNDERSFESDSFIEPSMFKRILSSKWFPGSEQTIDHFNIIEEVFMNDVTTVEEWKLRFESFLTIKDSLLSEDLPYHPLHGVANDSILCWIEVISKLSQIQEEVFSMGKVTIAAHAKKLYDVLSKLENIQDRENNEHEARGRLVDRMQNIVEGIESQERIILDSEEFGDLIDSLFQEQEDEDAEDNLENETNNSPGLLVTSLQNIAYQEYNYLFVVQFTQDNYPSTQSSSWPLHNDILWKLITKTTRLSLTSNNDLERLHADREKYYFYLSFLSAKVGYSISYAKFNNGLALYPSHYLNDLVRAVIDKESLYTSNGKLKRIDRVLDDCGILNVNSYHLKESESGLLNSEEYNDVNKENLVPLKDMSLADIGIYQLCPKRFYYSNQYSEQNVYKSTIQLSMYLANELYTRTAKRLFDEIKNEKLVEEFHTRSAQSKILNSIPEAIDQEKGLLKLFPISHEATQSAIYYASIFMEGLVRNVFDNNYLKQMSDKGHAHGTVAFSTEGKEDQLRIKAKEYEVAVHAKRDLTSHISGQHLRTFSINNQHHFLNKSKYELEIYSGQRVESFNDWLNRVYREFFYPDHRERISYELGQLLQQIEEGQYTKQKGNHCTYCPFHKLCLAADLTEDYSE